LNPNSDNPSHLGLAILYARTNSLQEAQHEAKLALCIINDLDIKIQKIEEAVPNLDDDKDDISSFLSNAMSIQIILKRMLQDIVRYGLLPAQYKEASRLFETANFIVMICNLADPDIEKIQKLI